MTKVCTTGEADKFSKVEARCPYNLRNHELNINLPLPKTDFIKRSFAYAVPKLWNSLSDSTKLANSLVAF